MPLERDIAYVSADGTCAIATECIQKVRPASLSQCGELQNWSPYQIIKNRLKSV